MSLKGPFSVDKRTPWIINDSTGATATNVPQRDLAHELCALLNAGWEAKQVADYQRKHPNGPSDDASLNSPESRIAADPGIPVEKLVEVATEEAKKIREYPFEIEDDPADAGSDVWIYTSNTEGENQDGVRAVFTCDEWLKESKPLYAGPVRKSTEEAKRESIKPIIRVFCTNEGCDGSGDIHSMVAVSEDGEALAHHICSTHEWADHDMGIDANGWKRDLYAKKYPGGFTVKRIEGEELASFRAEQEMREFCREPQHEPAKQRADDEIPY